MKASILFVSSCLFFWLLVSIGSAQDSTNATDTLKQSVADLQKNPGDDALREKIIKLAAAMNPKPETPDEASRHFVKAATFLKEAKDKSDYELAVDEYRQALMLAPWWGAAYFNEGVALQSAGQFDQATAAFKLYLLTNPDDAADVKTRIYSMEAEKELAAKHAADETAKAQQEAANQAKVKDLAVAFAGTWRVRNCGLGTGNCDIILSQPTTVNHTAYSKAFGETTSDVVISGKNIKITWHHGFSNWTSDAFNCNISDDGQQLSGTDTRIANGAEITSDVSYYKFQ